MPQPSTYYTTPRSTAPAFPSNSTTMHFNPLTPPTSEPLASPKTLGATSYELKQDTTLTPHSSPNFTQILDNESPEDHLRRLQMSLEKNGLLAPASSPKPSEQSNDDDMDLEEYDEQGLRIPKMNSHGKVKKFKCKQCDFVAITKLGFWEHTKGHIKAEKMLTCPKCPFVTEYKHHLEYHLRNHFGSKPFKCDKCSYSCVNKSMLNSHMKSHSNVYQYRCADCSYATKYCHSLKLHLRKYSHKPAMVLNPDGTPNPLPIIDVYGTRRGPKQKLHGAKDEDVTTLPPNPLAQLMMSQPPQLPLAFPYPFLSGFGAPLFFQNMQCGGSLKDESECEDERSMSPRDDEEDARSIKEDSVLDLSKPDNNNDEQPVKNRRKGKAVKLDRMALDGSDEDEYEAKQNPDDAHDAHDAHDETIKATNDAPSNNNNKQQQQQPGNDFNCQFCDIAFGDIVLYTMHMGYHGYKDPFTCNMCGEQCNDKVSFFLHIARTSHS